MRATKCPKCGEIIDLSIFKDNGNSHFFGDDVPLVTLEDDGWMCPKCWTDATPADWTANVFYIPGGETVSTAKPATVQTELF